MLRGVKKLILYIFEMCEPAWGALMGTLRVCCVMLFCALMIIWDTAPGARTYELLRLSEELSAAPAGLLLIACIGTVCIQERHEKN